ncbi:hypothetical protein HPB50_009892 [Hyalomma asiaticum]|uniref:Uncharacterized protein n=1 Tax=Hyalomma asiaticum TaxID=266040 RepID=A0ACB7RLC7_HYAAI|nr:hypothetical protein HPB50_009892 [Hyalomma asiaticum]
MGGKQRAIILSFNFGRTGHVGHDFCSAELEATSDSVQPRHSSRFHRRMASQQRRKCSACATRHFRGNETPPTRHFPVRLPRCLSSAERRLSSRFLSSWRTCQDRAGSAGALAQPGARCAQRPAEPAVRL